MCSYESKIEVSDYLFHRDQYLLTVCAQRNSARGLEIGTGRPTSGSQNDAAVYYNAKDTESNAYAAQHNWQLGGTTAMTLGYTAQPFLGVGAPKEFLLNSTRRILPETSRYRFFGGVGTRGINVLRAHLLTSLFVLEICELLTIC